MADMIVLDASVLTHAVGDDERAGDIARSAIASSPGIAAPNVLDIETMSGLRRLWRRGLITSTRFSVAVDRLASAPVTRYETTRLLRRVFDLRENVGAYDAAYVALAESLGCPLVTTDARLARAPGLRCEVQVLSA